MNKTAKRRITAAAIYGTHNLAWHGTDQSLTQLEGLTQQWLRNPKDDLVVTRIEPSVADGVGHMAVMDVVLPTPDNFTRAVGLTTTVEHMQQLEALGEDEEVRAVFLELSTPGGAPGYLFDFAAQLMDFPKPVVTFTGDIAASAGMMMLVAGHEAYASESAVVGSIGVKALRPPSWLRDMFLSSENATNKLMDTESVQRLINNSESIFLNRVMEATGLTVAQIVQRGREGDLLHASEAATGGFISNVATRAQAYNRALDLAQQQQPAEQSSMKTTTTKTVASQSQMSAAPAAATVEANRWPELLAFTAQGLTVEQVSAVAQSSMPLEEAKTFLKACVSASTTAPAPAAAAPTPAAAPAAAPAQAAASAPAPDVGSQLATMAAAVTALSESMNKQNESINRLAAGDGDGVTVTQAPGTGAGGVGLDAGTAPQGANPPNGGAAGAAGAGVGGEGGTLSADEFESSKQAEIQALYGTPAAK